MINIAKWKLNESHLNDAKITLIVMFLMLSGVSFHSYAATESWQKRSVITNSFYEVALGSDNKSSALKIQKWSKPIRIYVVHQVKNTKLHDELLNAHIKDLRAITKLDIRRVTSKKQSNLLYYFTSEKKLTALVRSFSRNYPKKQIDSSLCMGMTSTSRDNNIQKAVIFLPVDRARMHAQLLTCIVSELTKVLGLSRDSDKVFPSIFNYKSINRKLTGLDIVLLKVLYNSRIKAGMKKLTLKPILKSVISKMQKKGELAYSAKQARTSSLCEYIGC